MIEKSSYFWKGSHSYHKIIYHLVFTPKYRRRIIQGEIAERIKDLFYECAFTNRWWIHEMEIMSDHVHLLLQLPASVSIAKATMYFKGGSSRILRKEYPELEEFLWGDSFWQSGYFVETIGRINEKTIREYIRNQKKE